MCTILDHYSCLYDDWPNTTCSGFASGTRNQKDFSVANTILRPLVCDMFSEMILRGVVFQPALFCAPLAEITHSAFRRLLAEFGGCGAQFTEMLSGRHILKEDLFRSPYLRRSAAEKKLFYQLMLRRTDPVDRIVGRLSELGPDGLDINLACYAPVIRQLDAGSRLFENLPALAEVLQAVRKYWPGLLTVKIRLGHDTIGSEERFTERLRVIEESGVDAITLHTRFFEDKFKRRSRHELFQWAATQTRLPIFANGDILGAETVRQNPDLFRNVAGLMLGRMAAARPWLFAAWDRELSVDFGQVWRRLYEYIREDFSPELALRRIRLFTKYYARNFHFGHTFNTSIQNAPTLEAMRERAAAFFDTGPAVFAEPSLQGL